MKARQIVEQESAKDFLRRRAFKIGDRVLVEPKEGYPENEFQGRIARIRYLDGKTVYYVIDQEDDGYAVTLDQLRHL